MFHTTRMKFVGCTRNRFLRFFLYVLMTARYNHYRNTFFRSRDGKMIWSPDKWITLHRENNFRLEELVKRLNPSFGNLFRVLEMTFDFVVCREKDIRCVSKHTCLELCMLPTTIWAEVCFCHWGHDESKPGNSRPERSRQGSSSDTAKTCRDQMTGTMRENKQQWKELFSVLNFNPKYYFMGEIRDGMS